LGTGLLQLKKGENAKIRKKRSLVIKWHTTNKYMKFYKAIKFKKPEKQ
jgi:hypothetical protein